MIHEVTIKVLLDNDTEDVNVIKKDGKELLEFLRHELDFSEFEINDSYYIGAELIKINDIEVESDNELKKRTSDYLEYKKECENDNRNW